MTWIDPIRLGTWKSSKMVLLFSVCPWAWWAWIVDRGNELAWADLGSHFSDGRGRQTAERTHTHNLKQDVGVRYVCTYDVCEVTPRRAGMERSAEQRHDHQTRPT